MSKDTIIISAFPACGKTWCVNNLHDKFDMSDSDSSNFSWIYNKTEDGTTVKERNPDFPNNYISHIKSLIGKKDFIFVSSHDVVRKALKAEGLPYFLVYPDNTGSNKCLWDERMTGRGSPNSMINFVMGNWDNFIEDMKVESFPFHYVLGKDGNSLSLNETVLNDIRYTYEQIVKKDIWGRFYDLVDIPENPTEPWNKE